MKSIICGRRTLATPSWKLWDSSLLRKIIQTRDVCKHMQCEHALSSVAHLDVLRASWEVSHSKTPLGSYRILGLNPSLDIKPKPLLPCHDSLFLKSPCPLFDMPIHLAGVQLSKWLEHIVIGLRSVAQSAQLRVRFQLCAERTS